MLVSTSALADPSADRAAIREALPGLQIDAIEPAPIAGFYEVVVGSHVVYVSADGRYMLQGDLIDLKTRLSLTEPRRREAQRAAIEAVGEDKMIIFKPEKVKHKVTVFTDIDCGYCRKLHGEMDQYLDAGIEEDAASAFGAMAATTSVAPDRSRGLNTSTSPPPARLPECLPPTASTMA